MLLHKKVTVYLMFHHYLCCINEDYTGTATWLNCSVEFWRKGKQFLYMVDGVCAVLKTTLNFTTYITVCQEKSRVEASFFHRILQQF